LGVDWFEDEYCYAMVRQDWVEHYDETKIEVIYQVERE
jgi:hypothetical protein